MWNNRVASKGIKRRQSGGSEKEKTLPLIIGDNTISNNNVALLSYSLSCKMRGTGCVCSGSLQVVLM